MQGWGKSFLAKMEILGRTKQGNDLAGGEGGLPVGVAKQVNQLLRDGRQDDAALSHALGQLDQEPGDRRSLLRAELDAAFFHLYGGERDDADYILGTFPIVNRKNVQLFGEERTRRLILETYDALKEATTSSRAFESTLTPGSGTGPQHV